MHRSILKPVWIAKSMKSFRDAVLCVKGVAAVEFALIAPILIAFWLGTNEFGQALLIDRRVTLTASSISDLVAQSEILTEAELDEFLGVADTLMAPALMSLYKTNNFRLTVINVTKDSNGNLSVVWSRKKNGSGGVPDGQYPPGPITASQISPNFDADVVLENSFQIVTKAEYDYTPAIGRYIAQSGGMLTLSETFFLAPRKGKVDLTP